VKVQRKTITPACRREEKIDKEGKGPSTGPPHGGFFWGGKGGSRRTRGGQNHGKKSPVFPLSGWEPGVVIRREEGIGHAAHQRRTQKQKLSFRHKARREKHLVVGRRGIQVVRNN